jgi:hypothetical protein
VSLPLACPIAPGIPRIDLHGLGASDEDLRLAILLAGAFTFMPGRVMHRMFLGG